ncbi:ABC transporter ATP-binding protein [Actinopolymorpha alba]|uniref:ABC transporter ATP-binding protein n=1 Tax=Actinopolymorpha alba TaxID=533267 RepID=UPI000366A264|nr:ABC transporter ATP-binding protein [Actinopolymorpha alba]
MPIEPENPTRRRSARRAALGVLIKAFPARTGLLAAYALLIGALPAAFSVLVGRLIDLLPEAVGAGLDSTAGRAIVFTLMMIGVVLVAQEVIRVLRGLLETDLYRRHDEYLLARVMSTTLSVPGLDLFEDPELAGRTNRAIRIAQYGPGELISGLSTKWANQAQGLAATAVVAYVWPVAALLLLPVWILIGRHLRTDFYRANPFWAEPLRRAAYLKRLGLMPEWAKELRIFGLTGWLVDRFSKEWRQVMTELWRTRRVGYRTTGLLLAVALVGNVAVIVYAARSALRGDLGVGDLTVLIQGMFGMAFLAAQDGDVWIENGAIPVPDVLEHERLAAQRVPTTSSTARSASGLPAQEIRFENVRFAYPGRDRSVFDGLDLTIEAGRSLAIVGLNGAGKTTLIKLLTGLTLPQSGRISVDGVSLADLDQTSWRQQVGAIFQDFVHYQLPARDNIAFGAVESLRAPEVDERVLAAARRAGADTVLDRLPDGLDTVLSRRHTGGVDLSGGQWQRIALARALAAVGAGARVLVLDEPTAHLDVRAEADLYDRFIDLTHGLTSIVISHRFSTVRRADRIVVLDGGRIAEDGTHEELVAAGGQYATLFRTQASRYHPEAEPVGGTDG